MIEAFSDTIDGVEDGDDARILEEFVKELGVFLLPCVHANLWALVLGVLELIHDIIGQGVEHTSWPMGCHLQ